ncbi:cytochrome P450 52A11 [Naviculisporaceae sp. PSN 640]
MTGPLSITLIALLAVYLYRRLSYKRLEQYAKFPQHLPSRVLGHLATVDEFMKKAVPPKGHADMAFAAMHEALGRPPVMLVDLRPVSSVLLVVGNYSIAEQVTGSSNLFAYGPPKVREMWKEFEYLTGPSSIVAINGEEWKTLRKRFSPGFQPRHLLKLLPSILDKISLFIGRLEKHARTGEEFLLQSYATDLTFDIIGRVALDIDMDAQLDHPSPTEITEYTRRFRSLISTYAGESLDLPWWCTPWKDLKRRRESRFCRQKLRSIVRERHTEYLAQQNSDNISSRSILSMSLQGIETLTPQIIDTTCDQLSTFLFAGHDTTSTLMSWALYELSRTPRALAAVRSELDSLLGPDTEPSSIIARLSQPGNEDLLNRMPYISAVLKETLRLWPPGGSSRMTPPGTGLTISTPETGTLCLDGLLIYPIMSIIQRDPAVFGETANQFIPERWLDEKKDIPLGAWRPFERGPRNCIGQELALIEVKAMIAVAVRHFDFEKVGLGATLVGGDGEPEVDEAGQFRVKEKIYQTREVTSKPVDGMRMKVRFARLGE